MLSPLLYDIFFAITALELILVRLSADDIIDNDRVHLEEEA